MTDQVLKDMDKYWGVNDETFHLTAHVDIPLDIEAESYETAVEGAEYYVKDIEGMPENIHIEIGE